MISDYTPYIIIGLVSGSIYGISAMGLVLTYKTSGIFNFAHGATSAASAYLFYELRQQQGWPWPLAAVVAVLLLGPLLGLLLERLAALLSGATVTNRIVATIGLLVAIQSGIKLIYGDLSTFSFDTFLPDQGVGKISGVEVTLDNIINLLLGVAIAIALYLLFNRTRLGVQMRAVVDDPDLLDMTGPSPTLTRRYAWMIGSTLAAASGLLFAAAQHQVDVNVLSLLIVQAFGAAALARFTSVPVAFVGGIAVGLLQQIVSKLIVGHENLQGIDLNVPFLILFVILVLRPRGLVEVGRFVKASVPRPFNLPPPFRFVGIGAAAVLALLIPQLVGTHITAWTAAASQLVLFLSLSLLVRTSGQISLCHIAFAAIGAAAFSRLLSHDVPWLVGLALAGLVVVPFAAFIAIPAIRLSGLFLGLATLGFGIFIAQYGYPKNYMFGGSGDTVISRPGAWGLGGESQFYYLLLAIAAVTVAAVVAVERSRLGRLLRGMADSPTGLVSLGASINVTRVIVFCISGFLAGVSGATFGAVFGTVSPYTFNYVQSLLALAVLAVAGNRTVMSSVIAAVLLFVVPDYISDPRLSSLLNMTFGLVAVFAAATSSGNLRRFLAARNSSSSEDRGVLTSDRVDERRGGHWRDASILRMQDEAALVPAPGPADALLAGSGRT